MPRSCIPLQGPHVLRIPALCLSGLITAGAKVSNRKRFPPLHTAGIRRLGLLWRGYLGRKSIPLHSFGPCLGLPLHPGYALREAGPAGGKRRIIDEGDCGYTASFDTSRRRHTNPTTRVRRRTTARRAPTAQGHGKNREGSPRKKN